MREELYELVNEAVAAAAIKDSLAQLPKLDVRGYSSGLAVAVLRCALKHTLLQASASGCDSSGTALTMLLGRGATAKEIQTAVLTELQCSSISNGSSGTASSFSDTSSATSSTSSGGVTLGTQGKLCISHDAVTAWSAAATAL